MSDTLPNGLTTEQMRAIAEAGSATHFVGACDRETILALLADRDALAAAQRRIAELEAELPRAWDDVDTQAVNEAREQALEEAAKCAELGKEHCWYSYAREIAAAIRALKGAKP